MLRGIIKQPAYLMAASWDFKEAKVTLDANALDAEKAERLIMWTPRAQARIKCFTEFTRLDIDYYYDFAFFVRLFGVVGLFPYEKSETLHNYLGWDGEKYSEQNPEIPEKILDDFRKEVAPELRKQQTQMRKVIEVWEKEEAADSKRIDRWETLTIIQSYIRKIRIQPHVVTDTVTSDYPTFITTLETKDLMAICYLEIWGFVQGIYDLKKCENEDCGRRFESDPRGGTKYCPFCRKIGPEKTRQINHGDYRKKYQNKYWLVRSGKMTWNEFEKWKKENRPE